MADRTAIEWCDATFNPWIGCTKVSPACDHCYAAVSTPARALNIAWGAGQPRRRTSPANWKLPLRWNQQDYVQCRGCGWRGSVHHALAADEARGVSRVCCGAGFVPARRRVFCASLADVFDNEVDPQWRADLLELIDATPNLDWLLLTKRIGNVVRLLTDLRDSEPSDRRWGHLNAWLQHGRPPENVWLGATVCNQAEADRDIPKLLATPAAVRFLSMEPLLGPVELRHHLFGHCPEHDFPGGFCLQRRHAGVQHLDWVIAGGESGTAARPMHPEWVRSLRDQCAAAGVPFLFKQWGEWAPHSARAGGDEGGDLRRGHVRYLTGDGREADGHFRRGDAAVARVGKKLAGRLLDGVEHNGTPQ